MSFILDALRKSEHERQRSAVPGLAQVPLATPQAQIPRWALGVMGVLGAAVLALGAVLALATQRATTAVAWPFAANARVYLQAGCGALLAALTLSTLALNVESSGEAVPLPARARVLHIDAGRVAQ